MAAMEDLTAADWAAAMAADWAAMAADWAADPASLGISREFSIEYGLGKVFQWVWTTFGLGLPMGLS